MESHSDEKTTSRRSFAKSVVAILASVPLASTLVNAQRRRKPVKDAGGKVNPSSTAGAQRTTKKIDVNEHDTPPPLLIMQGSCVVEIGAEGDTVGLPQNTSGRHKYRVRPKGLPPAARKIYMAHIKVVTGSGDKIFQYDNDSLQNPLEVSISLVDGESLNISTENDKFLIDVKNTKKLDVMGLEQSMNPLKRKRFRYMNTSNGAQHLIKSVKVSVRSVDLFEVELPDPTNPMTPGAGMEFKVMIWWDEA